MGDTGPQLRDIHLPPEPSWWPPAPGWWIVFLLVAVLLVWLALRTHKLLRRRRRNKRILAGVARMRSDWREHGDTARLIAEMSVFLRRLGREVDATSASLLGEDWIRFLDRHNDGFGGAVAATLLHGPYQRDSNVDVVQLFGVIEKHAQRVLRTELADV